jgi:hypothetical protein
MFTIKTFGKEFALKSFMLRLAFLLPHFLLLPVHGQSLLSDEDRSFFTSKEDSLSRYIRESVKLKDDIDKIELSTRFSSLLNEVLEHNNSWAWPFDSLKKTKMLIEAPDHELRIITWDVPMQDETHHYYGFIQHLDPLSKKWNVFPLEDHSDDIRNPENSTLSADKWFGCYYHTIVETYYKDRRYYTLLGWDGNGHLTQKKIIDILWFNSSGDPQFGDGIFEVHKLVGKTDKEIVVWQKRVIFEFKQNAVMALNFEPAQHLIVYDYLAPEESWQKGQYQYYVPSLELDAYKFKKGKWYYVKNAKAGNSKGKEDKYYNPPKDISMPKNYKEPEH